MTVYFVRDICLKKFTTTEDELDMGVEIRPELSCRQLLSAAEFERVCRAMKEQKMKLI